jgi:hypothetical protein
MTTCKGCGAPIKFVLTLKGRRMPVDVRQTTIAVPPASGDDQEPWLLAAGHVPHHITCPNADQFRRDRPVPARSPGRIDHPGEDR